MCVFYGPTFSDVELLADDDDGRYNFVAEYFTNGIIPAGGCKRR